MHRTKRLCGMYPGEAFRCKSTQHDTGARSPAEMQTVFLQAVRSLSNFRPINGDIEGDPLSRVLPGGCRQSDCRGGPRGLEGRRSSKAVRSPSRRSAVPDSAAPGGAGKLISRGHAVHRLDGPCAMPLAISSHRHVLQVPDGILAELTCVSEKVRVHHGFVGTVAL